MGKEMAMAAVGASLWPAILLADHTRNIMITGYWPPTNEMVRKFSTDGTQNPEGWQGQNWEGRGYDIYSFFPECTDSNLPVCDGNFEVDYQDTSTDWWALTGEVNPVAIITHSRGFPDESWELEMNQYNRAYWIPDYVFPFRPTPAPPDSSVPAETLRLSTLPVLEIVDAVLAANLGLDAFVCFSLDGGGFLSEFIAYHGVWYQDIHKDVGDANQCVAAGHIHVGEFVEVEIGEQAVEVSLRVLIDHVDGILRLQAFDADGDEDIDLFDFSAFQDCVTGPGGTPTVECEHFDFDQDSDVDSLDFAALQRGFTG